MSACPKCGTTYPPHVRICTQDGTVLDDAPPPKPDTDAGSLLDRKYRLDALLGKGGMGAVYRATHVMLGKTVAVKLIKADLVGSPDMVRRFQREARAATSLNHPNIVSVYDLGQAGDGTLYIAMEMVAGRSLKEEIVAGGPMAAGRIARLLTQTASALGAAHRHQIVHRDMKPQNLMLTRDGRGEELIKLLDFGIAKTHEEGATQLTQTGFALGTPQYMAPEQAAGKAVDGRTDLYALGVILYEMLTGEVPFNDPSTPAVLVKHLTELPEPPSRRRPGLRISPTLERVALKCLEKDPADRFQTADEFIDALAALGSEPAPIADGATVLLPDPSTAPLSPTGAPTVAPASASGAVTSAGTAGMPPPLPVPPPAGTPAASVTPIAAAAVASASAPPSAERGTRPTAPAVAAPGAPTRAAGTSSSRKGPFVALGVMAIVLLLFAGAAGLVLYRFGFLGGKASQAENIDAPSSSPAMASNQPAPAPEQGAATPTDATADAPADARAPAPAESTASASGGPTAASSAESSQPGAGAAGRRPSSAQAYAPATAQTPGGRERPAVRPEAAPEAPPPPPVAAPPMPAVPAVFVECEGAGEVCSALRTALVQALEREGATVTRRAGTADVVIQAAANAGDTTTDQQFGTTFTVTSFTMELSAEAPAAGNAEVSMPAPRTFSFDARFGRDRLAENARALAGDAADRVMRFWKKHTGR